MMSLPIKKLVERLRVHNFLNGLDEEFEQIRGEILRRYSVLDLEEIYAYVHRDYIRQNTSMVNLDTQSHLLW